MKKVLYFILMLIGVPLLALFLWSLILSPFPSDMSFLRDNIIIVCVVAFIATFLTGLLLYKPLKKLNNIVIILLFSILIITPVLFVEVKAVILFLNTLIFTPVWLGIFVRFLADKKLSGERVVVSTILIVVFTPIVLHFFMDFKSVENKDQKVSKKEDIVEEIKEEVKKEIKNSISEETNKELKEKLLKPFKIDVKKDLMGKKFYCYDCVEAGFVNIVFEKDNTLKMTVASIEGISDDLYENNEWLSIYDGTWKIKGSNIILNLKGNSVEIIEMEYGDISTLKGFEIKGKEKGFIIKKMTPTPDKTAVYWVEGRVFWARKISDIQFDLKLRKNSEKLSNNEIILFAGAGKNLPQIIERGLKGKVDINTKNMFGETPFAVAIKRENHEAARYLIESGADISIKYEYESFDEKLKRSALALAVCENYEYETAKLLIEKGADVNEIVNSYDNKFKILYCVIPKEKYIVNVEKAIAERVDNDKILDLIKLMLKKGLKIEKEYISKINSMNTDKKIKEFFNKLDFNKN